RHTRRREHVLPQGRPQHDPGNGLEQRRPGPGDVQLRHRRRRLNRSVSSAYRSPSPPGCPAMRLPVVMFLASLALLAAPAPTAAQSYSGPIIDVHMHAGPAAPGAPNPATGQPTTANTDADRERLTLERMRQHGLVLGLVSGPEAAMASVRKAGGEDMSSAGAFLADGRTPLPPADVLREAFANGDLKVMGEIGAQYHGLDPSDEWFEPYLVLAEEFDIPVGMHTGLAPPGTAYGCCPDFSVDRKSTRLNSSHVKISYAVFCLKKKRLTRTIASLKSTESVAEFSAQLTLISEEHTSELQSRANIVCCLLLEKKKIMCTLILKPD